MSSHRHLIAHFSIDTPCHSLIFCTSRKYSPQDIHNNWWSIQHQHSVKDVAKTWKLGTV